MGELWPALRLAVALFGAGTLLSAVGCSETHHGSPVRDDRPRHDSGIMDASQLEDSSAASSALDSGSSRSPSRADAAAADEDAGAPESSISDKTVAWKCQIEPMRPETAASLGWQLLRCRGRLSKLNLDTWKISELLSIPTTDSLRVLVTRDHLIVQDPDALRVLSLSDAKVVSLANYRIQNVSSDDQRLIVTTTSNFDELFSLAMDGNDVIRLGSCQKTLTYERWLLCPDGQRIYSVDVTNGTRHNFGEASSGFFSNSPFSQVSGWESSCFCRHAK